MFELLCDNWMTLALGATLGGFALLVGLNAAVLALSVWQPEAVYDRLLTARKLFTG